MGSSTRLPRFVHFGEYQLDTHAGELRNGHGPLQLPKQPLEILFMLVEHAGDVVTREELRAALWSDQTFVDFEDSLNHAVRRLREALGDSSTNPRFIETIPRRGYRLIAPIAAYCPAPFPEATKVEPVPLPESGQDVGGEGAAPAASQAVSDASDGRKAAGGFPAGMSWVLRLGVAALVLVVIGAVLIAVNVGGLRDRLQGRRSVPRLVPKRVAVAIFENRTGDPALDTLGKMAAESVSQELVRIETIQVVPSSTAVGLTASGSRYSQSRDPVRTLAEATSSGLVVTGAYYLQGQTLQLRTTITDAIANRPLYPIAPTERPRDRAMEAVETVQQKVLDTLAARYLNPLFDLLVEESQPPRYDAQMEFRTGFDLFFTGQPETLDHLKQAIALDPGFVWPHFTLGGFMLNRGDKAGAEAQWRPVEKMQLTPIARRRLDWCRASVSGRLEERHSVSRDIVGLVPGNVTDNLQLALDAQATNRPQETVEVLRKPLPWELVVKPGATLGVVVFMAMTGALHELGQHDSELQEARRGRRIYPDLLDLRTFEAQALVALGRLKEVDGLIDETLTISPHWSLPGCCVPGSTPGNVMLPAAEELRAHGYREASLKMASRAVDWYRSRVGARSGREDMRSALGHALYQAERWSESRAVFASLAAKTPGNISYKGRLGALAARMLDPAVARRIAEELQRQKGGDAALQSARILAVLGDKERAVALLQEAIARGLDDVENLDVYGYGLVYRHSMDLESLRGYPAFEELVTPKE